VPSSSLGVIISVMVLVVVVVVVVSLCFQVVDGGRVVENFGRVVRCGVGSSSKLIISIASFAEISNGSCSSF
jgi:hypothetical protein